MKCDICGTEVKRKVYWQKHCSPNCKQAAWAINKVKTAKKEAKKK